MAEAASGRVGNQVLAPTVRVITVYCFVFYLLHSAPVTAGAFFGNLFRRRRVIEASTRPTPKPSPAIVRRARDRKPRSNPLAEASFGCDKSHMRQRRS